MVKKSIRLLLKDAGIAANHTHTIMTALRITEVDDLAKLNCISLSFVDEMYWHKLVDLRNSYKSLDAPEWVLHIIP